MSYPTPIAISDVTNALTDLSYDAVIVVAETFTANLPEPLASLIEKQAEFDSRIGNEVVSIVSDDLAQKRLVLAPTGQLNRYFDDVRRFYDAANSAAKAVLAMGQ